mmetsp:Transcript_11885/g.27062  ORF Transcript_11885/g.27062 Transcript_11885/m.27062 type:complete len:104 (+) Transcript_11885:116-427(+)
MLDGTMSVHDGILLSQCMEEARKQKGLKSGAGRKILQTRQQLRELRPPPKYRPSNPPPLRAWSWPTLPQAWSLLPLVFTSNRDFKASSYYLRYSLLNRARGLS